MLPKSAPRRLTALIAVGALGLTLALASATSAQASDTSSAVKLEAAIQAYRANNSTTAFLRNSLIDAWMEKGVAKYAAHPTTNFTSDLGTPPQAPPVSTSPIVLQISHATVASAVAALENYDNGGLLDTSAQFGPAGWVTKGSTTYIGFSTVQYPSLPWQSFGHVSLPSQPVVGTSMHPKITGYWPTPDSYTYAWSLDGGATTISTDPQYTPGSSDPGHKITVTVTAVKSGYQTPASVHTTTAHKVIKGHFTAVNLYVGGYRDLGQVLSATVTSTPSPIGLHYVWKKDGHAISGEGGSTYTIRSGDFGHRIDVAVTIDHPGFVDKTVASHTSSKTGYPLLSQPSVAPSITSVTATVGATETADPGSWDSGVTFSYQWFAGSHKIAGATHHTYVVSGAYYGKTLTVNVTGHKHHFTSVTAASPATFAVDLGHFNAPTPTITGHNTVGSTLTGHVGTWHPSATHYTYQWYLGTGPIAGATHSTYKVISDDVGHMLYFRVFGTRHLYEDNSPTSVGFSIS